MEKFWMIVEIGSIYDSDDFEGTGYLNEEDRPKIVHYDEEKAIEELLRLSEKCKGYNFVILESMYKTRSVEGYVREVFIVEKISEVV